MKGSMAVRIRIVAVVLALFLVPGVARAGGDNVKLNGYAEYRMGDILIVDGQRVRADKATQYQGKGQVRDSSSIPLGYEVKVKGVRLADGSVLARKVKAKPNGMAFMEEDLREAFDKFEKAYRTRGRMFDADRNGGVARDYGRLHEDGPEVERVRRITANLVPPYMKPEDFRVYVVENKEWNAMAAPNNSIYVFTGLLHDMEDSELAIILGHELVHATHEHSRRQFKRGLMMQFAQLGAILAAEEAIDSNAKRTAVQIGTVLGVSALYSGYSRAQEDQADRVGLRYANEGGYDVSKGVRLWTRFSEKYGDTNKAVNFFFGDHSRSSARAAKLQREIRHNYTSLSTTRSR